MKPIHLVVIAAVLAAAGLLYFVLNQDAGPRSTQRTGTRADSTTGADGTPIGADDPTTGAGGPALKAGTGALSGTERLLRDGESFSYSFQIGGQADAEDRGACCVETECLENLTRDCLRVEALEP